MIERLRSIAQATVPLPWVWVTGTVLVGVVAWCVQLQAEVAQLSRYGSPTASSALQLITGLQARVDNMQEWIAHISINDNRLTKIETQIQEIQEMRGRAQLQGQGAPK
jgi:hypothetical protein